MALPIWPACCSGWLYVKHLLRQDRLWPGGKRAVRARQGRRPPALHDDRRAGRRAARLRAVLRAALLPAEPARHPGRLEGRHGVPWRARSARIIAIVLFARRVGVNAWSVLDLCAAATPMGLFFGRIANFINGELWGRPSDVPWAMVFPGAGPVAAPSEPALRGGARGRSSCLPCCAGSTHQGWRCASRASSPAPSSPATGWRDRSASCSASRTPDCSPRPLHRRHHLLPADDRCRASDDPHGAAGARRHRPMSSPRG